MLTWLASLNSYLQFIVCAGSVISVNLLRSSWVELQHYSELHVLYNGYNQSFYSKTELIETCEFIF